VPPPAGYGLSCCRRFTSPTPRATGAGGCIAPDGTLLANGESKILAGAAVEAIAAYDIKPGEPSHQKGKATGYVVTLGGKRIYLGASSDCLPEVPRCGISTSRSCR